ncbi:MAG: hypothetical protein JWM10_2807 [Myxococcaceae bacterium]|nr:hypothetical protein [Myxococcaceae bacterium]
MIERRFHRELYPPAAVDGALKVFERFATFELADEGDYRVVRISAKRPERELKVARELGNYALGLTRQGGLS